METEELFGLIVFGLVSLGLVGLSIPLMLGKCTGLIAGYNTMTPEEKERYNGPALARFTGKILLVIGLATALYDVGLFCFALEWLTWAYLALVIGLGAFAVIWCNTGGRFKK